MTSARPDPDQLLRRVQAEERAETRGKLTIFFGAAPGVGKTFTMLEEAGYQRDVEGRDVVAGVVETHGRFEITTLLAGFERLPKKTIEYRGTMLEEFDLDAALSRKPSLLLLDELAHTNVEGSRHAKRWQDVEELREAGIEVYTTLNVQHVESLNDVVAQITGVVVRETVPDSVLESANEIKLIDLPPDELLERLREGKVYVPAQVERALQNFFRKGNLIALRELALRKTAERVDADMHAWRLAYGIEKTWAATDRLLVAISPSPYSANLLRAARRVAAGLHAKWYAVNVETPATLRLPAADRTQISKNLRLAEQLGAETVTLTAERAAEEIIRFARSQNVTKLLVGKPRRLTLRELFGRSFVHELILGSGDIDVYVTAGEPEKAEKQPAPEPARRESELSRYLAALLVVALSTGLAFLLFGRDHLADTVMTYLLGIVIISTRFGFRPSLMGAALSVLAFDFFFIPPYLTFTVSDVRHVITFSVMLLVAVVIAGLTQRVRDQVDIARKSERRSAVLYALTREIARAQGLETQLRIAGSHIEQVFDAAVAIFTLNANAEAVIGYASEGLDPDHDDKDAGVVRWVAAHAQEAGRGTGTLAGARGFYLPLWSAGTLPVMGVLAIYPKDTERFSDPEQRRLADAFATQVAVAIERARLAEETEHARLQVEAEQLRSTLLSSVSHDLRTPLAVMKGAASTLVDDAEELSPEARKELGQALLEETERLDHLVRDLLEMTRLESGTVRIQREWQSVEEVVGAAFTRTESRLEDRNVTARVPGDLLALFDGVLVEAVLVNLLENAAKYTPPKSPIDVNASVSEKELVIEVADRGRGVPDAEKNRIFEKFYRGPSDRPKGGIGLGLTICRAIILAHGGRIWVEDRPGGGAAFKFALPLVGQPPDGALPEIQDKLESKSA